MRIVFFKTPKPKRFNLQTRYYDEEKEYWEQRRRELGISEDGKKADFKSRVGKDWKRMRKGSSVRQRKANVSVVIYIAIVIALLYYFFFK
jgi:type VI protein secretion system component VasF